MFADGVVTPLVVSGNGTPTAEIFAPLGVADQRDGFSSNLSAAQIACRNTILFGWSRANTSTSSSSEWVHQRKTYSSIAGYNYTMLACHQQLAAHPVNVTVDPKGLVLGYDSLSTVNQGSALPVSVEQLNNLTALFTSVVNSFYNTRPSGINMVFHNDGNAKDWFSYLMALQAKSSDFLDPDLPAPNPDAMATRVNTTYKTLAAVSLGLNYATSNLLHPGASQVQGYVMYQAKRVSVSTPMFIIALVILSLNLLTAIANFIYTGRNRLPWFPSSLAATIAYFADSDALVDVQRTATMSTRQRDEFLQTRGSLYGLGKIPDQHGKERWVIDHADKIFNGPDKKLDARLLNRANGPRETEPRRNELYGFF